MDCGNVFAAVHLHCKKIRNHLQNTEDVAPRIWPVSWLMLPGYCPLIRTPYLPRLCPVALALRYIRFRRILHSQYRLCAGLSPASLPVERVLHTVYSVVLSYGSIINETTSNCKNFFQHYITLQLQTLKTKDNPFTIM